MNKKMWGIVAGVALAVAGSFGVAVGTYSLPDPTSASVGGSVYERVDQRAAAFWEGMYLGAEHALRIEVFHTSSAGMPDGSTPAANVGASSLNAALMKCLVESCEGQWAGCEGSESCEFVQGWDGAIPAEAFTFDPAMSSAHFKGTVQGCDFEVSWTGEGEIVPVSNHDENTHLAPTPWRAEVDFSGLAELSRVAPATIVDSCLGLPDTAARGYMSQGLTRSLADAFYREPGEDE
jgi:hypothetical protein